MMPSVMMARVMLLLVVDEEDDMMIAMIVLDSINEMSDSTLCVSTTST